MTIHSRADEQHFTVELFIFQVVILKNSFGLDALKSKRVKACCQTLY